MGGPAGLVAPRPIAATTHPTAGSAFRSGGTEWPDWRATRPATTSFQNMDTNHNGYLTVEEMVNALHENHASHDAYARGGWLLSED